MGTIRVHDVGSIGWQTIRELTSAESRSQLSDTELDSDISFHEPGSADDLQLMEVIYLPNATIEPHAHDEDEIMYIVEGEMHLGKRVLGPGCSLFIAGSTLYGYRAGPDGLRLVNFRGRADYTFHTKAAVRSKLAAGHDNDGDDDGTADQPASRSSSTR